MNGRPVFVKAVNYIPWQHFAEVGRTFYDRDMRLIAEAHGNSIGVHAHVQSPHAYDAADAAGILDVPGLPAAVVLRLRHRDQSRASSRKRNARSRTWRTCSTRHPSVVYYACHNEPLRMFGPTAPEDDTPGARRRRTPPRRGALRDAAVDRRLAPRPRSVRASATTSTPTPGSLNGGNLYRVSELPAWFVSEYGFWTVGPQAEKFGDHGLAADHRRRCASG